MLLCYILMEILGIFSIYSIMLATGLPYMAFIMSSKVPPTPSFFRTFILKGCWSLHKSFLHCFKWPHEFVYMTSHIYRSLCVELSLLPWNETYVIVMRHPFDLFLNLVGNFKKFICALCVWAVPVPWLMEEGPHKDEFSSFLSICGWVDGHVPRLGNKLVSIEPSHKSLQISCWAFLQPCKIGL